MENFYELLGVPEDAEPDEIERAWRERVHRYHPDVNDDTRANAQFKTLKTAHEVLSDETERTAYDRLGHRTYVQERLDGLPTARYPSTGGSAGTDRDEAEGKGPDEDAGRTDRSGAATGSRTGRSGSRGSGGPGGDSGTGGRGRTTNTRATGGSGTQRSNAKAAGGSGTQRSNARAAGGSGGQTDARTAATSSAGRRRQPRRPLAYGWAGIAITSLVYLLGLWTYLSANEAVLSTLSGAPPATIPSVLLRAHDLVAPGTFVLDAAGAGSILPLAFGAGAVGLAVVFVAVVVSFGRGVAYLYAAGGLAPAAALAIGPVVAAPDGATLVLAVVIPVTTVVLFLIDVGRELLAGP